MTQTKVTELLKTVHKDSISVELTTRGALDLESLKRLKPYFCTVAWIGNFGELPVREIPPIKLAKRLASENFNVVLNLPGNYLSQAKVKKILDYVKRKIGIVNIFAVKGSKAYLSESDCTCDFPYAEDLVQFIKRTYGDHFDIGVTAYPETYPGSPSLENDLEYLKRKVDMGADFMITQASFNADSYLRFREECVKYDIKIPMIPGIYIIGTYDNYLLMAKMTKMKVNDEMLAGVERYRHKPEKFKKFGIRSATKVMIKLVDKEGISPFHFFTMDNLLSLEIVMAYNIRDPPPPPLTP